MDSLNQTQFLIQHFFIVQKQPIPHLSLSSLLLFSKAQKTQKGTIKERNQPTVGGSALDPKVLPLFPLISIPVSTPQKLIF